MWPARVKIAECPLGHVLCKQLGDGMLDIARPCHSGKTAILVVTAKKILIRCIQKPRSLREELRPVAA
jgi:hypothetical protein